MANIMDVVKLRNKPSRNGFDLSFKNNFTAKCGELLPVMVKPVLPGDSFKINVKSFTRTQPINTAAFARMREYYDFYFVPFEQLWNKFDVVITQMKDNLQHSSSLFPKGNVAPSGDLPYVTCEQIANYISNLVQCEVNPDYAPGSKHNAVNIFGFKRSKLTVKLLSYLGYPDFSFYLDSSKTWKSNPMAYNLKLSVFPLLAYHKVYSDYFRNTQWERSNPSTFNLDFIKGVDDLNLPIDNADFWRFLNFFDLRYSNLNKDLFFGVQPNAQFGEGASVSNGFNDFAHFDVGSGNAVDGPASFHAVNSKVYQLLDSKGDGVRFNSTSSSFSILALRQAEAFQRWKEISQSVSTDYKNQIESQWGVKVSQFLSHESRYLGGTATSLDINPVVNQNLADGNSASLSGIGSMSNNGFIEFESKGEYGYIICLYHSTPIFDYSCKGVDSIVTDTNALDFPIPVFDRVGMEQVPSYLLSNPILPDSSGMGVSNSEFEVSDFVKTNPYLGYAPRYVRWKTSVDVVNGAFRTSLKNWVLPMDIDTLGKRLVSINDSNTNSMDDFTGSANAPVSDRFVSWEFFKTSPSMMDTLFAVKADESVDTDQFLCSSFFDVKVVRNLDVDGLPY